MATARKVVRKEQARHEFARLREDLAAWLECRQERDPEGQYETQLAALSGVLEEGIEKALADLDAIGDGVAVGAVYDGCRLAEERAVFLRRYWEYFRTKWEQREDPQIGPVVRAADEVVWSCWTGPFRVLGVEPAAAPLPYVEPFFTPRAIPRVDPPLDLRGGGRLADALRVLPVPVIGVPPVCVARPWWLIFVAHETGHHLHHDLAQGGLREAFKAALAATPVRGPADWAGWHLELFADTVSVLLAGTAAEWAMCELLQAADAGMVADDGRYPSPVVRDAFMAQVLASSGLLPAGGVPPHTAAPVPGAGDARTEALLRDVAEVASSAATAPLTDGTSLKDLCAFDAGELAAGGEVDWWRGEFAAGRRPAPSTSAPAARRALAGAVAAWREVAAEPDAGRRAERTLGLCKAVLETLPECRPGGRRAAPPAAVDTGGARDALLGTLLGPEPLMEAQ